MKADNPFILSHPQTFLISRLVVVVCACLDLLQMEMHSARYSSHHDCPFISFELSVGQMVKWVNKREQGEQGEQWAQVTTQTPLRKVLLLTNWCHSGFSHGPCFIKNSQTNTVRTDKRSAVSWGQGFPANSSLYNNKWRWFEWSYLCNRPKCSCFTAILYKPYAPKGP